MNAIFSDLLTERVRAFVARERGLPLAKVPLQASLFHDLGTDGFDGVELLEAFAREFHVDLEGIRCEQHFGPEAAFNPFCLLLPSWWRRRFLPITVADLVQFAHTRRWSYPYPEPSTPQPHA